MQNIADILVDPEGALERRNHWDKTSHSLLVGAILHVLYAEEEKTLARVATLLSDPQRSFAATLRRMMATNHFGTADAPRVHPVVASAARELLNKSENERSGVLSTAMSFLGLYRDPTVAAVTAASDWRIADLVEAAHPVSLYLVVPPSDISRTKPLVRLMLNQIGRRLTEELRGVGKDGEAARGRHRLLMMLDEFPALGRLDFFETSLAFLAGYGVRAFLIAQSLNQIEKAYGEHNAILDNCHVRIAFATNDERMRRDWLEAYDFATKRGAQFLGEYARSASPFANVGERAVSVQVTSVVRASDKSFQVKWTEATFERGSQSGTSRWTAILTTVTRPPASTDVLRKNPLGIYVDAIDWSRELDTAPVPPPVARPAPGPVMNLPLGSPLDPNVGAQPLPAQPANLQETNP